MIVILEFVVLSIIYYVLHFVGKTSIVFFVVRVLVIERVVGVSLLVVLSRVTSSIRRSRFV